MPSLFLVASVETALTIHWYGTNGFLKWLVVQAFFCMNLVCVIGYAISAGGFASSLGLNEAQLGLAGGTYFFAYSFSQLFLGFC